MTAQVVLPTIRYFHERYLSRPSCPRCGELVIASECQEFSDRFSGVEIRHFWACDGCENRFNTLVTFKRAFA